MYVGSQTRTVLNTACALSPAARNCQLEGFGGQQFGPARHDHIWYDDGSNSGFFDDDSIRPDDDHSSSEYSDCRYIGPDDVVREAEWELKNDWDSDWRVADNNCQHYTQAVEEMAKKLMEKGDPWTEAMKWFEYFGSPLRSPDDPR